MGIVRTGVGLTLGAVIGAITGSLINLEDLEAVTDLIESIGEDKVRNGFEAVTILENNDLLTEAEINAPDLPEYNRNWPQHLTPEQKEGYEAIRNSWQEIYSEVTNVANGALIGGGIGALGGGWAAHVTSSSNQSAERGK